MLLLSIPRKLVEFNQRGSDVLWSLVILQLVVAVVLFWWIVMIGSAFLLYTIFLLVWWRVDRKGFLVWARMLLVLDTIIIGVLSETIIPFQSGLVELLTVLILIGGITGGLRFGIALAVISAVFYLLPLLFFSAPYQMSAEVFTKPFVFLFVGIGAGYCGELRNVLFVNFPDSPSQNSPDQPLPMGDLLERYKLIEGLFEVSRAMIDMMNLDNLLPSVVKALHRIPGADNGILRLFNSDGELEVVASFGASAAVLKRINLKNGEGYSGRVIQSRKPLMAFNAVDYHRSNGFPPELLIDQEVARELKQMKSFICVPVPDDRHNIIGSLFVYNLTRIGVFGQNHLHMLNLIANQLGMFILKDRNLKKEKGGFIDTVKLLGRLIDAKDRFTQDHSIQVSRYAVEIGRGMGIPEESLSNLAIGGLVHDIGMIGVPDAILNMTTPLNDQERELVRTHPIKGYQILQSYEQFARVILMVLHHHERLDGSGYPHGLKGDQIPVEAKIIAVADSFQAMISARPYRPAKTEAEAKRELVALSGKHYDPLVVSALLNTLARLSMKS